MRRRQPVFSHGKLSITGESMSFTSNIFILFLAVIFILYYLVPKRMQWGVLLAASYIFYLYAGRAAVIYLIISTALIYQCGRILGNTEDIPENRGRRRGVMLAGLIFTLLILIGLKILNSFFGFMIPAGGSFFSIFLLPLGISYYTFQLIAYLLDVYWKRSKPESSLFRFALFVSFFPQLLQGPIGRYERLEPQLFAPHDFDAHRIKNAAVRIVWGLFKSMLLGGWAGHFKEVIFSNQDGYAGIAVFGIFLYSVELYGNFSGGIDIALGVGELFGVKLDENFKRPYFSVSISDFWRRWHITLGTWMKDYVMVPLTTSAVMMKLGVSAKKVFGRKKGRVVPICISSIIVFFLVGVWHGFTPNYIGWGLYNGILIAGANFFADNFTAFKKKHKINDKSKGYHVFTVIRTFLLVNLGWYFDCFFNFKDAWKNFVYSFTRFEPSLFLTISSGNQGTAYTPYALLTLGAGVVILFAVSLLQENGIDIINGKEGGKRRIPLAVQYIICVVFLLCIILLSPQGQPGGFIYQQF